MDKAMMCLCWMCELRKNTKKFTSRMPILFPSRNWSKISIKYPKIKKVIVHCAAGKRSAKACEILKDKGLKELYNMAGGISKWQAEGYPVEKP